MNGALRRPGLLGFALWLCPRNFREEYREQIYADAAERGAPLAAALDVARYAVGVRLEGLVRELLHAVRSLLKARLFTAVAVLTFALAISVNAVVFALIAGTLLKPLPFTDAEQLVFLCPGHAGASYCNQMLDNADIGAVREHAPSLAGVGAFQWIPATLTGRGNPQSISVAASTWNALGVLHVRPQLGRFFTARDAAPGVRNVVITDRMWRTALGADPHAVGSAVVLDGVSWRVIGVAPANALMPSPFGVSLGGQQFDLWEVLPERTFHTAGVLNDWSFARIAPGATLAAVNTDLARVSTEIRRADPVKHEGFTLTAKPFAEWYYRRTRWLLFAATGAVAAVLLIACANLANLLLARGMTRTGELAVRSAVGASRAAVVRTLGAEMFVIALAGAAVGLVLSVFELDAVKTFAPAALRGAGAAGIDWRVAAFTLAIVALATVVAGIAPAFFATPRNLTSALKASGRGADAAGPKAFRAALIVVEIALAFAVVTSSGLMVRSFLALASTDLGFNPHGVYVAGASLYAPRYRDAARRAAFVAAAVERIRALPGVESVGAARPLPFAFNGPEASTFRFPGRSYTPGTEPNAMVVQTTPDTFRALGTPLLRGRAFTGADRAGAAPVAIVDATFVQRYLGGLDPIGKHLIVPNETAPVEVTIVGVVHGTSLDGMPQDAPQLFVPFAQSPAHLASITIKLRTPDPALREHVASIVAAIDPQEALQDFFSMEARVASAGAPQSSSAVLLGILAAVALLLALAGIYAIVSYSVEQRRHEFGVRMAVGARGADILRIVFGGVWQLALIGIALGVACAALTARSLENLLFGISQFDPVSFAAAAALLLASVVLASALPALRAARIDPSVALRYE